MNNIGKQGQPREQKKKREVEAPVCLGDLFAENDEEKEDECFNQLYEVQDLDIGGSVFKVRQFAWHGANANKVWPGTFNLAEFICLNKGDCHYQTVVQASVEIHPRFDSIQLSLINNIFVLSILLSRSIWP